MNLFLQRTYHRLDKGKLSCWWFCAWLIDVINNEIDEPQIENIQIKSFSPTKHLDGQELLALAITVGFSRI